MAAGAIALALVMETELLFRAEAEAGEAVDNGFRAQP